MRLEQSFEVAAPLERVWQALIDLERVAPCLPGAAITGRNDDRSYNFTFTVKIGPTTASYSGKLELERVDEERHHATLQANGTDRRGHGGAKATIVSSLSSSGGDLTRVSVDTDYHITGRLARLGRSGMIEDIAEKLLRQFAACLQESMAADDGGGEAIAAPAPDVPAGAPAAVAGASPSEVSGDAAGTSERDAPAQAPPPAPPVVPTPAPQPLDAHALLRAEAFKRVRRAQVPLAFLAGLMLAFVLMRRGRR